MGGDGRDIEVETVCLLKYGGFEVGAGDGDSKVHEVDSPRKGLDDPSMFVLLGVHGFREVWEALGS